MLIREGNKIKWREPKEEAPSLKRYAMVQTGSSRRGPGLQDRRGLVILGFKKWVDNGDGSYHPVDAELGQGVTLETLVQAYGYVTVIWEGQEGLI